MNKKDLKRFEKAKKALLALKTDGDETPEEFVGKIFALYAEYDLFTDFEWSCKTSFIGGEG